MQEVEVRERSRKEKAALPLLKNVLVVVKDCNICDMKSW